MTDIDTNWVKACADCDPQRLFGEFWKRVNADVDEYSRLGLGGDRGTLRRRRPHGGGRRAVVPRGVVTAFAARMLASAFWTIADHFGSTIVALRGRPPLVAAARSPAEGRRLLRSVFGGSSAGSRRT